MDFILDWLFKVIIISEVQVGLATVVAMLITLLTIRYKWVKPVVDMAHMAYEFAEDKGHLNKLKGYEKLKPFFEKLDELYEAQFAKLPTPSVKARAVQVMEKRVIDDHKPATPKGLSKRRASTFMLLLLICWMAVMAAPPEPVLAGEWYGSQSVTYYSNRDSKYIFNLGYEVTDDWNIDGSFNWDVGLRTSWGLSTTFQIPFSNHVSTRLGVNFARDGTYTYVTMMYL